MNQDRLRQIEDVFHLVLAARAEEQARLLDERCASDAELHREVSALLASAAGAGAAIWAALATEAGSLAAAAHAAEAGSLAATAPVAEAGRLAAAAHAAEAGSLVATAHADGEGRRLGPYRLRALLGEGGMGAVYLADRDDAQFAMQVAIKILPHALAAPQAITRFRDERQILAALDHRNIVRLLDGGSTDEGLPYLVMEYIKGEPITRFAARRSLSVRARVQLVRQVCAAIQYAHQHLIIHRDIKPANILVDEAGTPKLLDFGIAKLLVPVPGLEREALTRTGHAPFTPAYASPEQVRGEAVSTATDVYSLGAVLYELVTGRPPHRTADHLLEQARAICEVEPARPSAAAPPERRRELAGDLDNIILKALHKEPARRYGSIAQLADDLGRFLDGMPVAARVPTLGYRARKLAGRHRAALLATALVAAALVAATVISLREAAHARRARDELVLRNAEIQMSRDPTAVVAALADYHGEDLARRRQLLAEAAGRGVVAAELRPHSDTIWFLAGDASGAVFSLGEDHRISVTRGARSEVLASDVGAPWVHAYATGRGLLAYARTGTGIGVIDLSSRATTRIDASTPAAMAIAADGSRLAALDSRGHLTVWSLPSAAVSLEQDVPGGLALVFADPVTLVVREKSALRVFSLGVGQPEIAADTALPITAADARGDEVAVGDGSGRVTLFSRALGRIAELQVCHQQVHSVRLAARARLLSFTCQGRIAGVLRYDEHYHATSIDRFDTDATSLSAEPDLLGARVVVTDDSNVVYLYDVERRLVTRYEGQPGRVSCVAPPAPGFDRVLVGDINGTVRVWRPPPGHARLVVEASDAVFGVAFSPDGTLIATDGVDHVVRLTHLADGAVTERTGHTDTVTRVRFSPDGQSFLSFSYDRTVRVWSPAGEAPLRVFRGDGGTIEEAEYIEDGRRVVSAGDDGRLLAWSPRGHDVTVLFAHGSPLVALEVLGDRGHIAVHDRAGGVWDVSTDRHVRQVRASDGEEITMLRASPDGSLLAVGTARGAVALYRMSDHALVREIKLKAGIRQIAFDPRDRDILILCEGGHVELMTLDTQRSIPWRARAAVVRDVAYAKDGETIALSCEDGGVWLYSVRADQWVYTRDHDTLITSGQFSPDGALFVSADRRGRVVARDVARTFIESE